MKIHAKTSNQRNQQIGKKLIPNEMKVTGASDNFNIKMFRIFKKKMFRIFKEIQGSNKTILKKNKIKLYKKHKQVAKKSK